MQVRLFGSGYVGLVTGACRADAAIEVICVGVNAARIARPNADEILIHERDLEDSVARNRDTGRLIFTTDAKSTIVHGLSQVVRARTSPCASRAVSLDGADALVIGTEWQQ